MNTPDTLSPDGTRYSIESSSLSELDGDFRAVGGRSFQNWLTWANKCGGTVLEIGGGREQIAAQAILGLHPDLRYVAVEPRSLTQSAHHLVNSERFSHLQGSAEDVLPSLEGEHFSVVFAHFVAEHMRNPLQILEGASRLTPAGSAVFLNRVPLYREVCEGVLSYLQRTCSAVSSSMAFPEVELLKKGIVRADISVVMPGSAISLPIEVGDQMVDFHGNPKSFAEITLTTSSGPSACLRQQ